MNNEVERGMVERWICGVLDWLIDRARDGYDQRRMQMQQGR
jgi:hypothetical protein